MGPSRTGGQMTISSPLFGRQFTYYVRFPEQNALERAGKSNDMFAGHNCTIPLFVLSPSLFDGRLSIIPNISNGFLSCRVSSRRPRPFCFGKRTQNHFGRSMALRVPCAVHRHLRRANSLRSNSAHLFSGVGCTAQPCHQAREPRTESRPTLRTRPKFVQELNKAHRKIIVTAKEASQQASEILYLSPRVG